MSNKVVLKNLVNIDSGFAFKSYLFTEDDQYIPIIRIRDVNSGVATTYYSGEYDEKYIVNNGDLLISMDGSFIIKKWNGGKALLNQRVCRIKSVSDKITDDYLFRILPKELKAIEDKTPFVTVKHLSVKSIENIEINLPSLEIQNKVVEVLDKAQELIDKRKLQIEALDELVKSRFIEMFGDFSKEIKYQQKSIGDLVNEKFIEKPLDGNHGEIHPKSSDFVDSGVPFIMANALKDGKVDYSNCNYITEEQAKTLRKGFAKSGDVLLTHKGTIGKTAIVSDEYETIILTPQVTYYRVINGISNIYLKNYFETNYFQTIIGNIAGIGSTRAYIGITAQLDLPIILPPIELQNQFTDFVKQVEKLKSQMETSLKELEDNFNSLMQKAFKGELF